MQQWWQDFVKEAEALVGHGGVVLWFMLVLSVVLYSMMASSWLGVFALRKEIRLLGKELQTTSSVDEVVADLELYELDKLAWVERRLPVLSVLIALAPLAGLLGTVSGMLSTFEGLSAKSTEKPIDGISAGISEALVTTQAGLFMAIPAALLFALLKSRVDQVRGEMEQLASRKIVEIKTEDLATDATSAKLPIGGLQSVEGGSQ